MISLIKKQKGFTIVELLIVIVVIGILAGLVITTFTGVQKRARDSERQTDINAINSQLEVYYTTNSKYPTLANLQDNTWVTANLKGLDITAMQDPSDTANANSVQAAVAANKYSYAVTTSGGAACDNAAAATDCLVYTLTATKENGGTHVKKSLN